MGFIYRAYNKISQKSYIGQTKRSVIDRWNEHLFKERDFQTKLARAIRKYKIDDWDLQILEQCDNKLLDAREKYWINYYDSYQNGYNSTNGGQGVKTLDYDAIIAAKLDGVDIYTISKAYKTSPQTIKYILDAHNITYESQSAKIAIPIEMIDIKTLQVIKQFNSITDAAEYNKNWNISTICAAINNKRNSAYGYYWRKIGENKQFQSTIPHKRAIIQYDKEGNQLQIFESIAAANKALGKPNNHHSIGNCLAGKTKTALGYKWKKLTDIQTI